MDETSGMSTQPQPVTPGSKKPLIIGLVAGAAALVVVACVAFPMAVAASEKAQLKNAAVKCDVALGAYEILDDGLAINFTKGGIIGGAPVEDILCVLEELNAPDSIAVKIGSTRSLDGTRDTSWADFTAEWTYHPDDGLNLLVEKGTR